MQPSGKWDKETPDTATKLHKPSLGCCTIPGTFMEQEEFKAEFRNDLGKCHLIVFTQPQTEAQACV